MIPAENERLAILNMIGEGKISVDEGARLLDAVQAAKAARPEPPSAAGLQPGAAPASNDSSPRWFRVLVTDTQTGRAKTSVQIPLALMRWGLNIGAQFAPQVNQYNLSELADMFESGYQGKLIDVLDEEDGEHVEIFCE